MTREQQCIVEMYKLLDEIAEKVKKHDFSLLRPAGSGGADMYQGAPRICRIFDGISSDYADVLSDAFRESEKEQDAKIAHIKTGYLNNRSVDFPKYLRERIDAERLTLSNEEIEEMLHWAETIEEMLHWSKAIETENNTK